MNRKQLTVKDIIDFFENTLKGSTPADKVNIKIMDDRKIISMNLDQMALDVNIICDSEKAVPCEKEYSIVLDLNENNFIKKYWSKCAEEENDELNRDPEEEDEIGKEEIKEAKDDWPGNKYIITPDQC